MVFSPTANKLSWLTGWPPKVTNVLLVVVIAYSLATLLWQIIAPPPPRDLAQDQQLTAVTPTKASKPRYDQQIAQLHLFGKASESQPQNLPVAPETRLNLTLRGVFSTDDQNAIAIIASGGINERFYRLGDSIPGGATLKAVYPDRVLLERNFQMETLPLPKSEDTGMKISKNTSTAAPITLSNATSGVKLSQLRKQILKNPEQLSKMVHAKPITENGQFMGYRLSLRGNASLAQELGLKSGDIVTSVNGIALNRPEKGLNALQNLVNAPNVTLTLLRDGNEVTLHHNLTQ